MKEGAIFSSYQNMKFTTPKAVGQALLALATICATQCLNKDCSSFSVFATEPRTFGTTRYSLLACVTLKRTPVTLSTIFTWDKPSITHAVIGEAFAPQQQVKAQHLLGTNVTIMAALNYEIKPGSLRTVAAPRCEWNIDNGCIVLTPSTDAY